MAGLIRWCVLLLLAVDSPSLLGQTLSLPPRPVGAISGSAFAVALKNLDREQRDQRVLAEVQRGNVPEFLRQLVPVTVPSITNGGTNSVTFWVAPDYLAVGADDDYFLVPLTPNVAQKVATATGCILPTRKMVDAIYHAASMKFVPLPIPPSPAMTSVSVFRQHHDLVWKQRVAGLTNFPLGALVAGHKKDVVISPQLADKPGRVAIYGWHRPNGVPIQPLYLGHTESWVDYSHGIRLVLQTARLNGQERKITELLASSSLHSLLSDEGPIPVATYPVAAGAAGPSSPASKNAPARLDGFGVWRASPDFAEQVMEFGLEPEMRVLVNAPGDLATRRERPVRLILYAVPNGNSIEQTIGRRLQPGDDWRFDIQHIGAQTRWLRERETNVVLVVAYLETRGQSWPAWRRQHGAEAIPGVVDKLRGLFPERELSVVLSGHSGGGSFIFGFIDTAPQIPAFVERIAFLDSNYAYDFAKGHAPKLADWLRAAPRNRLGVFAYHDSVALLDGRTFVSEPGGTWGRSAAMQTDLGKLFSLSTSSQGSLRREVALAGRLQFFLRENPERKIWHTVLVERNGFIHSLQFGTEHESRGYEYLGARAYPPYLAPEASVAK